jgi:hypothetical protein
MAILATKKNNSQKKKTPERRYVILHSYSTQNQQRPYQKLSKKWLLIISLSGCSPEQKLPSSVTHSPDRTRPGTPFFTSAIPGLRSALECHNLISSNSFAHRLGIGNSALRLTPGPIGLKPELRQGRSRLLTRKKKKKSKYIALDFSADFLFFIFYFVSSFLLI